MSAKRRASRAHPKAPTTITNQPSTDIPVVWIESRKDGISYGVRAYGKSVQRNAVNAMALFVSLKQFSEVVVPMLGDAHKTELLRIANDTDLLELYHQFVEWRTRLGLEKQEAVNIAKMLGIGRGVDLEKRLKRPEPEAPPATGSGTEEPR